MASVPQDIIDALGDAQAFRRTGSLPFGGGMLDQHPHWICIERILFEVEVSDGKKGNPKY
jgi:hypothetical protein